MQKIVYGILLEGKPSSNCFDIRTWRANGVMERSLRAVIEWTEIGPVPPLDAWDEEKDAERLAELKERSLKKAAQRAKTTCRRVIITEGYNELLTLTYRENQTDRELCKKHFSIWSKRMKRALGKFRYCASFEVQERGSMHVHIATHKMGEHANYKGVKIKTWQLGTKIWRDIVGANNGLCFVGGKAKNGVRHKKMSLAKMASYVSKYILKDYEKSPEEVNRYSRSNGTVIAPVHTMRFSGTMLDMMVLAFEVGEGDIIVSHRVSRFGDSSWLCTENVEKKPAHAGG